MSNDMDDGLERIERTRSEIAIYDAERNENCCEARTLLQPIVSLSGKSGVAIEHRSGRIGRRFHLGLRAAQFCWAPCACRADLCPALGKIFASHVHPVLLERSISALGSFGLRSVGVQSEAIFSSSLLEGSYVLSFHAFRQFPAGAQIVTGVTV